MPIFPMLKVQVASFNLIDLITWAMQAGFREMCLKINASWKHANCIGLANIVLDILHQ